MTRPSPRTYDRERWRRLKELFDELIDLGPDQRREHLAELEIADRTLFEELASLLSVDTNARDFLKVPDVYEETPCLVGESMGKYRIVRELGRGGMGAVFEGVREDGDFDKRVAIKLTGHNLFSDDLIRRFQREKQVLARLEHPNIVRLFDGGVTVNHIPYYVMEYVEGSPLTTFCRDKNLSIRDRLQLFGKVLEGVSYAHRNLIVHRDLKPSNILVTDAGDVKLLDFGIAKVLSDEGDTITLGSPMTPDYASPEQILNRSVSTASDIYSLGVILFELLTDLPPRAIYKTGKLDLYQAVLNHEPLAPSTAMNQEDRKTRGTGRGKKVRSSRFLAGDLDNVVLKCLHKEPEQRYASADQLLVDVTAYLDGRPVMAHPQSRLYLAGKFANRNRRMVGAATAALFLVLVGSGAALYQSSVAREQQKLAESRFQQVRKIANALIFDYHDAIAKLEGSTALRERLVSDAVAYLDAISAEKIEDRDLLLELAIAYRKVGDVHGRAYWHNLGNLEKAFANYEHSVEILTTLHNTDPSDLRFRTELSASLYSLAEALRRKGAREEAAATINRAILILPDDSQIGDVDLLLHKARLRLSHTDDVVRAADRYQVLGGLEHIFNGLIARYPENVGAQRVWARFELRRGNASRFAGYDLEEINDLESSKQRYLAALKHYTNYRNTILRTFDESVDRTGYMVAKRTSDMSFAYTHAKLGDVSEANHYLREARKVHREILSDPNNKEIRILQLNVDDVQQEIMLKEADLWRASNSINDSMRAVEELAESDPANVEILWYGLHFSQRGFSVHSRLGNMSEISRYARNINHYASLIQEKVGPETKLRAYF